MLAGKVDGASAFEISVVISIIAVYPIRPTVFLPTHDPQSAALLASRHTD